MDENTFPHLFLNRREIVVGDFNAYSTLFGAFLTTERGRLMEEAMEAHSYAALNTGVGMHLKRDFGSYGR